MPEDNNGVVVAGLDLSGVVTRLAAAAPAADAAASFPHEGIRIVHEAGLLELTVAERYGGRDLSLGDLARLAAALGRGDPSVALISLMTLFSHRHQAQSSPWPDALYERVLAEGRQRPVLLNAARGEPELGSPARGGLPRTLARRTPGGWSIGGTKRFVTGCEGLSYFLVWASTDETPQRVGTFIVPGGAPGIGITGTWASLGLRASGSHDVVFDGVEVGRDNVIGLAGADVAGQDNRAQAVNTLVVTALYLGVAEAAQEAFLAFAEGRVPANLGYPIARTERFVALAGEIDLLVSGARQLILGALDHAAGEPDKLLRARLLAGRQLRQAVQLAVSALGNPGLSRDTGLERHFRDIQSVLVHAPQEDTVIAILGRAAFSARTAATAAGKERAQIAAAPDGRAFADRLLPAQTPFQGTPRTLRIT
ncbi:Putative acyl-CoA dehydrogenase YdbM [Methylobacterium crusticola]|uniref:Acyl-CoA dehydrogenase YdbM n=1 Tax=Methylobacterium crusticola TaxID=1697972 RepID=A0ABQ4R9W7_9HYPH|nr:acyl-CoA dehydrogenase family protein [Methylobacterium crusticola]GJD53571.1 Putative acyl-CoA dehydrogenase YdbM [Methylobacterium crusticola]